jgi:hypothetical protein
VKPSGTSHPAHELLVDFWIKLVRDGRHERTRHRAHTRLRPVHRRKQPKVARQRQKGLVMSIVA